jgi:hypothetical protein
VHSMNVMITTFYGETTPVAPSCPVTLSSTISSSAELPPYLTEHLAFPGGAPTRMFTGANRGSALQNLAIGVLVVV